MSKEKVRPLQRSQRDRLQAQQESGSQHFSPCTGYVGHALRTRSFEKRETKEKRGGNVKRERAWFLGEGCLLRCASVPGLVYEGLDTEPAWEQSLRLFLAHAAGRPLCEGWRLVFPQICP